MFNKLFQPRLLLLAIALGTSKGVLVQPTHAALIVNDVNITYTIDFDTDLDGVNEGAYTGAGLSSSPGAGQLDSDAWAAAGMSDGSVGFGGTATTGDFARGPDDGGITAGGYWGFDVDDGSDPNAVNRAFGLSLGNSDWTPGSVTLRLQNTSPDEISQLTISYRVYYRNDQSRANSFNFAHSADDSSYSAVAALDYTSDETAADPPVPWAFVTRSTTLTGLSIATNAYYYLRWSGDDVSGSVSGRDEFALDDITISDINPIPEPNTLALGGLAVFGLVGTVWRRVRCLRKLF